MPAFRASTRNVAWVASWAAWKSHSTRWQTPKTKLPWRWTRVVKAACSRWATKRYKSAPSGRSADSRGLATRAAWATGVFEGRTTGSDVEPPGTESCARGRVASFVVPLDSRTGCPREASWLTGADVEDVVPGWAAEEL